ncbi:hypothetical protein GCK72_018850 [Caenorhabditis remanei]|uniref:Protein MAK10 homolog n=1 Tax=Caenorhabditis remanei TaxID=31234 RepID=A0A2P4V6C6_CAERE|nr:hypothetical protein GCK72_018850 [Caenorhabditis remanei]KAF1752296.1 hypothetical protein GCK72_018850 [Caenorhabditis remanei]
MSDEKEAKSEKKEVPDPEKTVFGGRKPLTVSNDVSAEFFELCSGLEVGELVTVPMFQLSDVMSAIELLEPKMDVGVNSHSIKTLQSAIQQGLYEEDMPMQLAIMDATIAMLVAWLEGSSLGTTLWTNVMLTNVHSMDHPMFYSFSAGMNLLVRNIYSLINNVGNLEELPEDFNPQSHFMGTKYTPRDEIINLMRNQMECIRSAGEFWNNKTGSLRVLQISSAVASRLDFIAILLEIMAVLVPPEIEDPNYAHKIHLGNTVIDEKDYEAFVEGGQVGKTVEKAAKNKDKTEAAETVQQVKTKVEKNNKKGNGKKGNKKKDKKKGKQAGGEKVDKNVEEVIDSIHQDKLQQKKEQEKPKSSPKSLEKKIQPGGKKNDQNKEEGEEKPKESPCCSGLYCDEANDVDEEEIDDEDYEYEEIIQFTPDFAKAGMLAQKFIKCCEHIEHTYHLGRRGPDDLDLDYTWLMPFDAKACVRLIPACFPRNVKIPTRKEAVRWWRNCAQRILDISHCTPNSVKDVYSMFYFAQMFTFNSCVFTKSLLQVCMFPVDNHLLGKSMTIGEPIEVALKTGFIPQVLVKDSPVYNDQIACNLYDTFMNNMMKCIITSYSSFGCNLTRQRDRLEMAIEELAQLQFHAGKLETRTDEVMLASNMIDEKQQNVSFHSVATFVFHNLLAIIHYYFELGFYMDLYVPYEFPYMFWFLGDVDARWMLTTLERSQEIQINYWKGCSLSTSVNPRHQKEKQQKEEQLKKRLAGLQCSIMNQFAMTMISKGIIKMSVVLVRKGMVKIPEGGEEAERLRFERRFECLQNLGPPLTVTYEQYKLTSGIDALYEEDISLLISSACDHFASAKAQLEKMDIAIEQNRDTINLHRIAKANLVATNLLKLGLKDRKMEWGFYEDYPIYPYLKISN